MMVTGNRATRLVMVDGMFLDPVPSQKLYNHSPDGFSWGYAGSGPAQLALALLLYFTNKEFALEHYQFFKFEVLCNQPMEKNLMLTKAEIMGWAKERGYVDSNNRG